MGVGTVHVPPPYLWRRRGRGTSTPPPQNCCQLPPEARQLLLSVCAHLFRTAGYFARRAIVGAFTNALSLPVNCHPTHDSHYCRCAHHLEQCTSPAAPSWARYKYTPFSRSIIHPIFTSHCGHMWGSISWTAFSCLCIVTQLYLLGLGFLPDMEPTPACIAVQTCCAII